MWQKLPKNLSRKILVLITIVLVTFSSAAPHQPLQPPTAEAGGGGPVTVVGGIGTIQETITAVMTSSLQLKEYILDPIAYAIAKQILNRMTASIISWINSGFEGKPAFVTDLGSLLRDAANQAVGEFIANDPGLSFLCSPFELDVKFALTTSFQQFSSPGGGSSEAAACTLDDVTGNIENFLSGAFDEGGWAGWFELTQNPGNTPDGALLAAEVEMYARIVNAQDETLTELDWGDGVQSLKFCEDGSLGSGSKDKRCTITNPGAVIKNEMMESMGVTRESLQQIDELSEIIPAIAVALVDAAIKKGFLALGSALSGGGGAANAYADVTGSTGDTAGDGTFTSNCDGNPDGCQPLSTLLGETILLPDMEEGISQIAQKKELMQEYQSLISNVIRQYDAVATQLESAKRAVPSCQSIQNFKIDADFTDKYRRAEEEIGEVNILVSELQTWEVQLNTAPTPERQQEIIAQFAERANDYIKYEGTLATEVRQYVEEDLGDDARSESQRIAQQFDFCLENIDLQSTIADLEILIANAEANDLPPELVTELEDRLDELQAEVNDVSNGR